tara:strand:+ start:748 stop:960 length:213 start_codon:yes stop_codon:yes gene_type:complete
MDIKFDDHIPIPSKESCYKYSFLDKMKIGQSFVVPYTVTARPTYNQQFKSRNMKMTARKIDNNLRIWRIA